MAGTQNSDRNITQQVQNRLAARGLSSSCRVNVSTENGLVTLTGLVRQLHQKVMAVRVASAISGVRRVIDQLTVQPTIKF
jgi:osmotically-inducible protein OsmY